MNTEKRQIAALEMVKRIAAMTPAGSVIADQEHCYTYITDSASLKNLHAFAALVAEARNILKGEQS